MAARDANSPPRVGILGGGQLARMTAEAARDLGIEVFVLERGGKSPAGQVVGPEHEVVGHWRDAAAREALRLRVDLITLENEFVDAEVLQDLVNRGTPVWPGPATLRTIQDKLRQKQTLVRRGLAVPRFVPVTSAADLHAAGAELGWPLVLKARRLGYDGHGNATVRGPEDIAAAIDTLTGSPHPAELDLYAEAFVPFTAEVAVMVARGRNGETAVYPVAETIQRDHICHEVIVPARVPPALAEQAREVALAAVEAVDAVGVVGVEFFALADGTVLINELAPRPHNSGHYTIEACQTSQYANHLRAVLGWPLGAADLDTPAAVMVNLLGTRAALAAPAGIQQAQAVPGAFLHLYGKREVRPGRKMGHLTALGETLEEARARAHQAANFIEW